MAEVGSEVKKKSRNIEAKVVLLLVETFGRVLVNFLLAGLIDKKFWYGLQ